MKKIFYSIIVTILICIGVAESSVVSAKNYGADTAANVAGIKSSGTVSSLAGNVIGNALTLVGVLFFILMLYGGILWMLARGNEQYSTKALGTITAAIIGLIIVAGAYAITQFVFNAATGQEQTTSTP